MAAGQRTGGFDDPGYQAGREERPSADYRDAAPPDPAWEREEQERARWEEANPQPEVLPHNTDAEAALLGALMIDNRLVDSVSFLTEDDFYDPMHGRIYARIVATVHSEKAANPVTLRPFFEADQDMKEVGGAGYLGMLTGSGAAVIGARDFAQQIADLSKLRQIYTALQSAAGKALDTSEDIDPATLLAELDSDIANIGAQAEKIPSATIAEAFDEVMDEFAEIEEGKPPAGITIERFKDWNAIVGRMEEGDLIFLGARPSMGKTGVAVAVALGAAAAGEPTEFFSLEMDKRKMTRRAIADLIYQPGVTSGYTSLVAGKRTMDDVRAMNDARELLADWPLYISDPAHMNVEDLAPAIRRRQRMLARRGLTLKLAIVDYLGRLGTAKPFKSETEQVSYISRVLKATAKICKIPLVVLVQLSRAVEGRENKRPMLADLRQSGSLEQDADTVVFLYRDEYYLERAEPPKETEKWNKWADELAAVRDVMEIYSSKRREGPLLKKLAKFFTAHQAVRDHDFFAWKGHATPIGPQDDDGGLFGGIPEARG